MSQRLRDQQRLHGGKGRASIRNGRDLAGLASFTFAALSLLSLA